MGVVYEVAQLIQREATNSFPLHRMVGHRSIPGAPESLHLFGKAEGYANVSFEKRITGSDECAPSS